MEVSERWRVESVIQLEEEEAHQIQEIVVMEYVSFLAKQTDIAAEDSQIAVALESATLGVNIPEKQVENSKVQKSLEHDFSYAAVGIPPIASPLVVDNTRALEYEYNSLLQKPVEYIIFTESKREEIHTFYGSNHSLAKSQFL